MARRSHNFTRRFSASTCIADKKKQSTATEVGREPTVKFHTNVTRFDETDLGGSEVDLTALKPNKFSEAASRDDGEL